MNKPAISVEGLSKEYRLGVINTGTFCRDLQSFWARKLGRPDPNAVIGARKGQPGERFQALDKISFTVQPGETLGIIGRNGAGKSTLLKVLSRVTAPTSGSVRIRGRLSSLLEVGTGFHPELTGRENIFLNGAILGMSKTEIQGKLDEIIAFSEVEQFIDTPVKRYSSGMYVRLAFAVAAHLEPEILVVDEVLAIGDYAFQQKCLGKMSEVGRKGRTVLFVSHNMGAIMTLCSRCILLASGKIRADGETARVTSLYLQDNKSVGTDVRYVDNPECAIQISRIALQHEAGLGIGMIDLLKPFSILVEYTVHIAVAGVVVSCEIKTQYGECLIATADHDLNRAKLGLRRVGHHLTRVQIPAHLLNAGTYSVVVGISGQTIYDRQEAFTFEVIDTGSFIVNGSGETRRNAYLLLGLPWEDL